MSELKRFQFGDAVTNRFASDDNPQKVGFFVRDGNNRGKLNAGPFIELTDGKGKFWRTPPDCCIPSLTRHPERNDVLEEALWNALCWIDQWDPEMADGAAERFGLDLTRRSLKDRDG